MTFQEMADIVKHRGYANGSIDRIEVEPFVYEENNVANTVVFEFEGIFVRVYQARNRRRV